MKGAKKFKIFYHNDMDGQVSKTIAEVWINRKILSLDEQADIESFSVNYSDQDRAKFDRINGEEMNVFIVDYSFTDKTYDLFEEIYQRTDNGARLIWIDHHDSSVEFHKKYILGISEDSTADKLFRPKPDQILISKEGSGAYLTWCMYLFNKLVKMDPVGLQYVVGNMYDESTFRKIPPIVRHVSDYDTFSNQLKYTTEFKLGYDAEVRAGLYNALNTYVTWDELCEKSDDYSVTTVMKHNNLCEKFIQIGTIIKKYIDKENEKVLKAQGYESMIIDPSIHETVPVYVCNRMSNSWVFGEKYDEYRYVVVYYFNGNEYVYSIFSNLIKFPDVDCRRIAELHGGGGHKGAAGWRSKHLMFEDGVFVVSNEMLERSNRRAASGCEAQFLDN